MVATYLYGIMEGTAVSPFLTAAGNTPVYTLARDGLACLVSDGDGQSLSALSKEQLVRRLLAHQQVVEQVMADHPVLPAKFGTILASPEEATDLLTQGREQLLAALAAFRDKVEIEVAATWNIAWVLQEAGKEEEVVRAREALARKGQPTLEDRLHLGQIVKACLDRRRRTHQERMLSYLRPLAIEVAFHPLVSDNMVMNVAFLLEKGRQAELDERVRKLDELFHSDISFRVIGPLPAYSFSTLEIVRITPEQLEAARRTLGMEGLISEARVRQAYRHAAARLQQGLNTEDAQAQNHLAQVRQAHSLLLACCRSQSQGKRSGCPAFLITARGPDGEDVDPSRFSGVPALPARA